MKRNLIHQMRSNDRLTKHPGFWQRLLQQVQMSISKSLYKHLMIYSGLQLKKHLTIENKKDMIVKFCPRSSLSGTSTVVTCYPASYLRYLLAHCHHPSIDSSVLEERGFLYRRISISSQCLKDVALWAKHIFLFILQISLSQSLWAKESNYYTFFIRNPFISKQYSYFFFEIKEHSTLKHIFFMRNCTLK